MKQNHLMYIIRLLMALLLLLISACDNSQNNTSEKVIVNIPASIQKLSLPAGTLRAWITVAGVRVEMALDRGAGTASAAIAGLSFSVHTVLIEYEYTDTINRTLLVASFSRTVDMSSGSTSISIAENQYITSHDDDEDGISNAAELALGTNPFGQLVFPESCFPLSIASSSGSLVFNFDGDLLFVDGSTDVSLVSHINCAVTSLASIAGESLVSVAEDKLGNRVYASGGGSVGTIYEIDPGTGSFTKLSDTGSLNYSMVLAPAGYGQYGGQLIVGTLDGRILAIDQSVTTPVPVAITTVSGGLAAALVFGSDGTLYVADSNSSKIVTVAAADGSTADFVASGLSLPAGLAIDNAGSRLLIADSKADKLVGSSIPAGSVPLSDTVDFSPAGVPGIAFDNRITLLMITAAAQIESSVINSFDTSCLPLVVSGALTGAASYTSYVGGDLLLTSTSTNNIYLLKRKNCSFSTLASAVSSGSQLLGLTYDQRQNMIYAGSKDLNIYAVDPGDGSSTLVTTVIDEPNGLVIAPPGYGAYAGQLIVALANGDVVAIDQTQSSPVPVTIVSTAGQLSDLVFGSDGTLYVADYLANNIKTLTSTGIVTTFSSGLKGPNGLAIDNKGRRLFVANSVDDTLKQVTIPSGVVSDLSSVAFADGFYPSGLFFDQRGTLLIGAGKNGQKITAFPP